jgi:ABC-type amino acid transport substrate-binding protein
MDPTRGHSGAKVWAVVAVIVLGLATCAPAQSSLGAIRERGVLRVGVKADAAPFGFLDERGRLAGFEPDLARVLATVLFDDDRRAQFVRVTTASRFEALRSGQVDLVMATITATEERRAYAELSESYFMSGSLLLVSQTSQIERVEDAAGRRIAVVRGSVQERDVAEVQSRAVAVPLESVAAAVRAVKSNQVDGFLYDDVVVLELARQDRALRVTGLPIRPRPYVAAARKGDVELIRWVNGWFARIRRDGSYAALWRRYFGAFESQLVGS